MIKLHKINKKEFYINVDLIEFLEETPDSLIFTTTGKKIFVKESISEIIQKIIDYKKTLGYSKYSDFYKKRKIVSAIRQQEYKTLKQMNRLTLKGK